MFPVKNTVIYTFFTIKSLQNTNFCMFLQCFQCSGIPKLFKTSLFTRFFHCRSFFHCRKPTKMIKKLIQNDPKFHLHALLSSNTHKSSQNIENTTSLWTRCKNCGLGAKSFLAPPSYSWYSDCYINKCDWTFSVAVYPKKHAFTAKAVWADLTYPKKTILRSTFPLSVTIVSQIYPCAELGNVQNISALSIHGAQSTHGAQLCGVHFVSFLGGTLLLVRQQLLWRKTTLSWRWTWMEVHLLRDSGSFRKTTLRLYLKGRRRVFAEKTYYIKT